METPYIHGCLGISNRSGDRFGATTGLRTLGYSKIPEILQFYLRNKCGEKLEIMYPIEIISDAGFINGVGCVSELSGFTDSKL